MDPILTILVPYAAGKVGDALLKRLFGPDLRRNLRTTAEEWVETLPPDLGVLNADSVFAGIGPNPGPAQTAVYEAVARGDIPTTEEFTAALLDHWETKASAEPTNLVPFFYADKEVARHHLSELARRLALTCSTDPTLSRSATYNKVSEIHQRSDNHHTSEIQQAMVTASCGWRVPRRYNNVIITA